MWRVWVGLLLLATPVWAEENATAYEALRVLGGEFGRDVLQQIVSIHGTKGDPQPEKWKIVVEDPQGRGVRELEIADGKIDSHNETDRDIAGSDQARFQQGTGRSPRNVRESEAVIFRFH